MKADWPRLTKHFANESAKIDLQRYLQNREERYLKSGWAEHTRLNGPWQTAEIYRLMDLLRDAPKKKGRPTETARNVDITRRFLCLQAIQQHLCAVNKDHVRVTDADLMQTIATDRNIPVGNVKAIVHRTRAKLNTALIPGKTRGARLVKLMR